MGSKTSPQPSPKEREQDKESSIRFGGAFGIYLNWINDIFNKIN